MVYPVEMVPDIDLGDDHYLNFVSWAPDDLPANRKWLGIPEGPLPSVEKFGATIRHYKPDGQMCEGCITFDGDWQRRVCKPEELWTVENWEPLTASPSLLCACGDHGFIRSGKWVRA